MLNFTTPCEEHMNDLADIAIYQYRHYQNIVRDKLLSGNIHGLKGLNNEYECKQFIEGVNFDILELVIQDLVSQYNDNYHTEYDTYVVTVIKMMCKKEKNWQESYVTGREKWFNPNCILRHVEKTFNQVIGQA